MSNYNTNTNKSMPGEKSFPMTKQRTPAKRAKLNFRAPGQAATVTQGKTGVIHHDVGCGGNHLGQC